MLIPQKPRKGTKKTAAETQPEVSPIVIDSSAYKVDFTQTVTQTVVLTIQDKTILTLGSLLVLTGKPKARKSTFLHTFLGLAVKSDKLWTVEVKLPENRRKVILIDTEQSLYDLHQSIQRLSRNFKIDLTAADLLVYTARALDVGSITSLINTLLTEHPDCSLLAIDGLIDLVNDINDVVEAKAAVHFLKQIADKFNVAILGILHQNKATNFSLGHLGSFLSRFAQAELAVKKDEDNNSSTMEATFLRSADTFEPITIAYDEVNARYDSLANIQTGKLQYTEAAILKEIFARDTAITYKELLIRAASLIPETKYHIEKKLVPYWYDTGMIKKLHGLVTLAAV
jgi:hypothetical protein